MKKVIVILIAALLMMSLIACNKEESNNAAILEEKNQSLQEELDSIKEESTEASETTTTTSEVTVSESTTVNTTIPVQTVATKTVVTTVLPAATTATTTIATVPTTLGDFRNVNWGMTMDQVKARDTFKNPIFTTGAILQRNWSFLGYDCDLVYSFDNNYFYSAGYSLTKIETDFNQYLTNYTNVKKALTSQYGVPSKDYVKNKEDRIPIGEWDKDDKSSSALLITDDIAYVTFWANALPNTIIKTVLAGGNKPDIVIGFIDKKYIDATTGAISEVTTTTSQESDSDKSDKIDAVLSALSISKAEYDQITTGMSLEDVCKIIGFPGEKVAESSSGGNHVVMYTWDGTDRQGSASFIFVNNKLDTKSQYGLK